LEDSDEEDFRYRITFSCGSVVVAACTKSTDKAATGKPIASTTVNNLTATLSTAPDN